jgi:hypothetical protein
MEARMERMGDNYELSHNKIKRELICKSAARRHAD